MGTAPVFPGWETKDEVLATVRAAGHGLSDAQLARRQRVGLIANAEVRPLGRGKGSVSLYPLGTGARLLRSLELGPGRPSFETVAWRVWWEDGGELGPLVRDRLRRNAAYWEAEFSRLAEILSGEEAGDEATVDEMERTYEEASEERVPTTLGRIRRNVGRDRFTTVFRILVEVASGRFEGYADQESELALERALGIDHARVDHLVDGEPWFEGDSGEDLAQLSATLGRRSLTVLAEAVAADLEVARQETYVLFRIFQTMASSIASVLPGDAMGLGTVVAIFGGQPEELQPFFVLTWLALREDPVLREGMATTIAALPDALAAQNSFETIRVLRSEVPAFASVMTDEALGEALLDPARADRLQAELSDFYSKNQAAVDQFVSRHGELEATTSSGSDEVDPPPRRR
jgi:hypothetical protein